jgi:hypothetical protein
VTSSWTLIHIVNDKIHAHIQTASDIQIPQFPRTAYSIQHCPASLWLTSKWPVNIIPLPRSTPSMAILRWVPSLNSYDSQYSQGDCTPTSNPCHCLKANEECCELYDIFFKNHWSCICSFSSFLRLPFHSYDNKNWVNAYQDTVHTAIWRPA